MRTVEANAARLRAACPPRPTAVLATPSDTHIQAQPAADVWSLDASLFWCWTGHRPVPYDDSIDRLDKLAVIAQGRTIPLIYVRPWPFPACLASDPADRPTAKELIAAW
ncbi:hypothetical protein [Streptomyces toxytricini]|uniref:hypothetical protein n=1 Tax=Streptomyces toxytricini TaxID=67369 RepID=UPI003443F29D